MIDCPTVVRVTDSAKIISVCLRNEKLFEQTLAASYQHPTGFTKIVLPKCDNQTYTTRIHYWKPESPEDTRQDIHNHAWSFRSLVIRGRINQRIYKERPTGSDGDDRHFLKYRLFQSLPGGKWAILAEPSCGLSLDRDGWHEAGDIYQLENHRIHQIIPCPHEGAATLVWQDPPTAMHSHIYSRTALTKLDTLEIKRLSRAELEYYLAMALVDLNHSLPDP